MERVVFVNQSVRVEPVNIVEGDTLTAIDIYFADLNLDSNHSVNARNLRPDNTTKLITSWSIPSANLYNYVEDGVLHQKVGRVDLGTLTWVYNDNWNGTPAFYTSEAINDSKQINDEISPNIICGSFEIKSRNNIYYNPNIDDVFTMNSSKRVMGRCFSYTNATDFKNAINGTYLYYELATEITKTVGDEVKTFRSTSKNTTNNYIRLYASADTFAYGQNEIQIKLYTTGNSKRTYTFIIPVVCHKNICGGD